MSWKYFLQWIKFYKYKQNILIGCTVLQFCFLTSFRKSFQKQKIIYLLISSMQEINLFCSLIFCFSYKWLKLCVAGGKKMAREKRSPGGCGSTSEKPQIGSRRLCGFSKSIKEGKYEEFQHWYPSNSPGHSISLYWSSFFITTTLPFKEHYSWFLN